MTTAEFPGVGANEAENDRASPARLLAAAIGFVLLAIVGYALHGRR